MKVADRLLGTTLACAILVLAAGCGGGPDDAYSGPTGTVKGTVKLDGTAVSSPVTVSFINTSVGFTASAQTDNSGNYSLLSKGSSAIPVGKYNITVIATVGEALSPEAAMEQSMKQQESGTTPTEPAGSIPPQYASPGTSGLTYEVTEGDNTHDIELTSK